MLKPSIKIFLIYFLSLVCATALFFYYQEKPAKNLKTNLKNQIFEKYQNFIWFGSIDPLRTNFKNQQKKQITIADLEQLNLSFLIKLENTEYLTEIEKIIKTAVNFKMAFKFPQVEEIDLPDKTAMKQKVAMPEIFVWQEKKIKPGFIEIWFIQKEDNYFGYAIIDLIDQTDGSWSKILAFADDENILENLDPNELIIKLKDEKNLLYADHEFCVLLQENLNDVLIFRDIEKVLILGDENGFKIETK